MSVSQTVAQYRNKYGTKVQNTMLVSKYGSLEKVKKLRVEHTFSELSTGLSIKIKKYD